MKIFSLKDAAPQVDLSPGRLRQMCNSGEVKAVRTSAGWIIKEPELKKIHRQRKRKS